MNAENFSQYIENPSLLYQMNYEELKQLILQYPFNSNLRYLLAKKSQQESHLDFDRNLKAAAINSPDRKQLYKILHGQRLVEEELEERLELKSLQELDLEVEEAVFFKTETPEMNAEMQFDLTDDKLSTKDIGVGNLNDRLTFVEEEPVLSEDMSFGEEVEGLPMTSIADIDISGSIEEEPAEIIESTVEETSGSFPRPLARNQLKSWRNRYQRPQLYGAESPSTSAAEIADQSVEDSGELVTETLADVLTHQQQFEKAIEVYERLSLLFPEKSDFFAGRIADIRAQMS